MEQQLEQLVIEAKLHPPQSEERQQVLVQLVEEILRSRKICRHVKQPLSGIYQEIYQQLQQQILCDIDQNIDQYNPQRITVREWTNQIRKNALRQVLNDAQLKKLALAAQQHPPNTKLRQQALIELVNAIVLSGRLCHPHRWIVPNNFYELIYEEAVNQTLVYVCQKIDKYNPQRGREQKFTNWVNFRLDRMVLEYYTQFQQQVSPELLTLEALENLAQVDTQASCSEVLRQCLEDDPNNRFKNEYIRDCPKANFKDIALATLSGKSWEEISAEFGVKVPTLSSFFQRSCQKFAPQFKEYF